MKQAFSALAVAAALLTVPALAQGPFPTAPTQQQQEQQQQEQKPPIPQRSVKITAEEGYVIKENVKDTKPADVAAKDIEIGGKAPDGVALHDFPDFVLQKVSAVKGFKYFVTSDRQVAVVSSNGQTIADLLK
ncbi:MAG: hypothetical protein OJF62_000998 [Pseudolabrys sp.]|jgi:hypothetical protein|nr:hypothetical protein [Pseudolabrys sp.]